MKKTKLLAIHLPQYHSIPENDEWWGEGFTEWTNVRRGRPLYKGHYQPREPLNDDYYDLSDIKVLEKQIRMAKKAGIDGFCFYHYYFKGKTLLEKPIESYRDKSKEKFPYCLIWANQSWTRTWYRDNLNNATLLQQSYGTEEDWENHFIYLLSFFKDRRYIKIDNKPVYIIYLPQDIKCRRQMFLTWDKLAKENGFNGIFLIAMCTGYGKDSYEFLYDAFIDFEPLNTIRNDTSWRKAFGEWKKQQRTKNRYDRSWLISNEYTYSYLIKEICKRALFTNKKNELFGLFSGWDNTPRKDEDGFVVRKCTPIVFQSALLFLLKVSQKKGKRFVFINAWNEWSEGAYLEPDKKNRYEFLKAIYKAKLIFERSNLGEE